MLSQIRFDIQHIKEQKKEYDETRFHSATVKDTSKIGKANPGSKEIPNQTILEAKVELRNSLHCFGQPF